MTKSITSLSVLLASALFFSCNSTDKENKEKPTEIKIENSKYSIASSEYEELAEKAIVHIADFQFSELYKMVSDDIEYYLPDGGETTRTGFVGKEAFMGFWDSYQEKSGNTKMTLSNTVHVPINVHQELNYTKVTGIMVLSYFSLSMEFGNEKADLRANFGFHFNDDKKIDKIYSYYDRTPIIEAAKRNILNEK